MTTGEVLEKALVDDPDDLAAHAAYADWLSQQGDPRGEFMQVQLALEDPGCALEERRELQGREAALLKKHARTLLGDVGRFLDGNWCGPGKSFQYQFVRGCLDHIRLLPAPDAAIASLARSPEAWLLSRLEIVYDMARHPFDFELDGPNSMLTGNEKANELYEGAEIMRPLLVSPYLKNLRTFKLGFSDDGDRFAHSTMVIPFENCNAKQIAQLLDKCPRLQELYLNTDLGGIEELWASAKLGNLRVLQYYYGTDYVLSNVAGTHALNVLANNASLKNLTTLRVHPGRDTEIRIEEMDSVLTSRNLPSLTHLQIHMTTFGDEGARRIVDSGILSRLKVLDIGYGTMTDDGARMLAGCPDLKRLEVLNVVRNALTSTGIGVLQGTGVNVIADAQHDPDEQDFLYEVDAE